MKRKLTSLLLVLVMALTLLPVTAAAVNFTMEAEKQDLYVEPGKSVTMRVKNVSASDGAEMTLQWYKWDGTFFVPIEGANGTSYTVTNVTKPMQFMCAARHPSGVTVDKEFRVHINNHLTVSAVGSDVVVAPYMDTVTLKVKVSATDMTGITYQWHNIERDFTNEKTNTLADWPVTGFDMIYCRVTDRYGNVVDFCFTLDVEPGTIPITIQQQPRNKEGVLGYTVEFQVKATGEGTLSYQWQYKGGSGWANCQLEGARTSTLRVPVTEERDNMEFRCVITSSNGKQKTSDSATLFLVPYISEHPKSITDARPGDRVTFRVEAIGPGLTYQWKYRDGTTGQVKNCQQEGAATPTLHVTVTEKLDSCAFFCVVTARNGRSEQSGYGRLTLDFALLQPPKNVTAAVGETAKFTVKATGAGLTYQWRYFDGQIWTSCPYPGNKTATLMVPVTEESNGGRFMCRIHDKHNRSLWTETVTLTVKIAITQQPKAASGAVGDTAKFTVKATGAGLTYQWQYKAPGSDKWVNSTAAGAKTNTLEVGVTAARNGQKYHCVVKDANGKQYTSDAARLTVKIAITKQPKAVSAVLGDKAKFTVKATGVGLTYQWQYKAPGSDKWVNSTAAGAKTDTLEIGVTAARNGQKYHCVVRDANGKQYTSDAATLTVKIAITEQPRTVRAPLGETAAFHVEATGVGLTYQWQYKAPGSDKWVNSTAAGAKTDTLEIGVTAARNGQKYHCVVRDANGKQYTSDAARLTVKIAITEQPRTVRAPLGETAAFHVEATGVGLTYQWQYKAPGSDKWVNSTAAGARTDTLEIGVTAARNGQKYHCVVKDANGKQYTSDAAKLLVETVITAQPQDVTAAVGETATFTVEAQGVELAYQWQYYTGSKWVNSGMTGADTAALSVPATIARNGQQYRCVITDGGGIRTESDPAVLTVK